MSPRLGQFFLIGVVLGGFAACDRAGNPPPAVQASPTPMPGKSIQEKIAETRAKYERLLEGIGPDMTRREFYARIPPLNRPFAAMRPDGMVLESHFADGAELEVIYELADPSRKPLEEVESGGRKDGPLDQLFERLGVQPLPLLRSAENPNDRLVERPKLLLDKLPPERPKREGPTVDDATRRNFVQRWRTLLRERNGVEVLTTDGNQFVFRFATEDETPRLITDWHPQIGLSELYLIGTFGGGDLVCAHANGALFAITHDEFEIINTKMSFEQFLSRIDQRDAELEKRFFGDPTTR